MVVVINIISLQGQTVSEYVHGLMQMFCSENHLLGKLLAEILTQD